MPSNGAVRITEYFFNQSKVPFDKTYQKINPVLKPSKLDREHGEG